MADINVNVVLPDPISVDVTSPTQALATNVSIPGPQGPAGIQGPSGVIGPSGAIGPQGPTGVVNTGQFDLRYYSITNPSGFITGVNLSNYATTSNLALTGSNLENKISSLSGTLTGNYLTTNSASSTYATISNLNSTGSTLNSNINSLSGTITGNYVTKSNGQFINRPTVNGTGVLLSGEAASLPTTILYTTGNQIKSGRLAIGDTIVDSNYLYTLSVQSNDNNTWLEILNHSGANKGVFFGIQNNDFEQYNWQAGDIKFFTSENFSDGTERLRIKNDGKVGIGTISPSEKLEVAGNLKVTNSGFFASGIKIGLNSIIITEESIKISGDPVVVRSTFTGYTGDVVNTYATITNLAFTGSTLQTNINNLSNTYATISNLANTGSTLNTRINDLSGYVNAQDNSISTNLYNTGNILDTKINNLSGYINTQDITISNNLTTTGSTLDNKINSLSGSSVLLYGNQNIGGVKTFRDNVYINNLFVTGTQTVVSTNNFSVQSPYLLLNLTGGAVDGGIFFVTGSGLTGINDSGPIIGFDHSKNFKFGISTRNSDLSTLPDIASVQDIQVYSGVADNKFSTISNLTSTGVSLGTRIDTLTTNLSTTGSTLGTRIDTLTTNLASTGSTLNTRINNLSGYINSTSSNIVFTTGNQTISGTKTFIQDTTFGDSSQGDFLVISGNNFTVYGSGNFTSGLFINGNPVLTGSSTLYATSANLASTGSTLDSKINNLSGYVTGADGTLTTNLASTGSTLNTKINNLSGYINSADSNIVFTTGNQTISGVKTFIGNHNISGNTTVSGFINISGNYDLYSQIENSKKLAIAYAIAL